MSLRIHHLIALVCLAAVVASCAPSTPTANTEDTPAKQVVVEGERAAEVIDAVATHAPGEGPRISERLVIQAARADEKEIRVPLGWQVTAHSGRDGVFVARFVWTTADSGPSAPAFVYEEASGQVTADNDAARELLAQAPPEASTPTLEVTPENYDREKAEWTGQTAKLATRESAKPKLDALAAVLQKQGLVAHLHAWLSARGVEAGEYADCADRRACSWALDRANDDRLRVELRLDLEDVHGDLVWFVSDDDVLSRSPITYLLHAAHSSNSALHIVTDETLRATMSSEALRVGDRTVAIFDAGDEKSVRLALDEDSLWAHEVRLGVERLAARGVDTAEFELSAESSVPFHALRRAADSARGAGIARVRASIGDSDKLVSLPDMEDREIDDTTVAIWVRDGAFRLARQNELVDPIAGCSDDGPTVCPRADVSGPERYDLSALSNVLDRLGDAGASGAVVVGFHSAVPASVVADVLELLRAPPEEATAQAKDRRLFDDVRLVSHEIAYGATVDEEVPQRLSRSMVADTLRGANAQIYECASEQNTEAGGGTLHVQIHVLPSGEVSTAEVVSEDLQGTPVAECVLQVIRSVEFPRTRSDLTIRYPFVIE